MTGYDRHEGEPDFHLTNIPGRPGLEVRCFGPSIDGQLASAKLARAEQLGLPPAAWLVEMVGLLDEFGDALISWTLTDRGRPMPPTAASLRRLSVRLVCDLVRAWSHTFNAEIEEQETEFDESSLGIPVTPMLPPADQTAA